MLDIMRKKKRMKAIVLWLVIIAVGLSMVIWGVALNLGGGSGRTSSNSYAAIVDDHPISIQEFIDAYRQSVRYLKNSTETELDPELMKSLGFSQQVLNRLIRGEIIEILAERLGLSVSPEEIRRTILRLPGLQDNGKFIGLEQYKVSLARRGLSVETFEDDIRYELLANKMTRVLTDSLEISEKELREEFSRRNQTAKVEYALLKKDTFRKQVKPDEKDLKTYFDEHKDSYQVKEKRRAEYLLVPTSKILPGVEVSEDEIKAEWDRNPLPETVEAAHILFLVKDPAEEETVRAKAESVLKQLRNGGDFAALAREYSEDTSSASQGGYLGTFPRGRMVKEFEDAAFSLKPGEISDLVRTPDYGFHIIKVFRHNTPTLESNRNEIINNLRLRKAKEIAKQKAEEASRMAAAEKDLNKISKELDVEAEVKETGLFDQDTNPYSIGISQALRDDIFQIEEVGATGNVVEHALGYAFAKLQEVQQARQGEFEEFESQVKEDYIDSESLELMKAGALKLSEEAIRLKSLKKAARELGLSVETSPDFKIDESPGADIKDKNAFNAMAFQLDQGAISKPVIMSDSAAVLEVQSRSPFDEEAFEAGKEALHDQMFRSLQESYLEEYFRAFSEKLEEEGKIRLNPEVFSIVDNIRI